MAKAGRDPQVVLEATCGWYRAVDVLQTAGAEVHLAHPLGLKAFAYRRVKNDVRDAADLADLLRMGRLPEAYVAPPAVRELRELLAKAALDGPFRGRVDALCRLIAAVEFELDAVAGPIRAKLAGPYAARGRPVQARRHRPGHVLAAPVSAAGHHGQSHGTAALRPDRDGPGPPPAGWATAGPGTGGAVTAGGAPLPRLHERPT
jgi:hypothetical protein